MPQYTYGLTQLLGHGHAFTQNLAVPDPAVSTGFTYRNDGLYWELIDVLSFQITTDSNAANRVVTLTVADGSNIPLVEIVAPAALTASKTGFYSYVANFSGNTGATDGPFLSFFPGLFLQPMFSVTAAIASKQAGDQLKNIRVNVERFVTGPEGYLLGVKTVAADSQADPVAFVSLVS